MITDESSQVWLCFCDALSNIWLVCYEWKAYKNIIMEKLKSVQLLQETAPLHDLFGNTHYCDVSFCDDALKDQP